MRIVSALMVMAALVQVVHADAPATSLRPVLRGGIPLLQPVVLAPSGAIEQPRQNDVQKSRRAQNGLIASLRPVFRSRQVEKQARAQRQLLAKGAVCGDIAIQGEAVGRVPGRIKGCGVENAVRVRAVSGVGLSQRAVMDCKTAAALKTWLETSAKPSLARKGGGLKTLNVAAHYACRTRNNRKGAKISEHGRGRAIDISGFRLANGAQVSVLSGWQAGGYRKELRRMHRGACGPFGTVLGPEADKFHRDHFHFDTARYRSGSYCK